MTVNCESRSLRSTFNKTENKSLCSCDMMSEAEIGKRTKSAVNLRRKGIKSTNSNEGRDRSLNHSKFLRNCLVNEKNFSSKLDVGVKSERKGLFLVFTLLTLLQFLQSSECGPVYPVITAYESIDGILTRLPQPANSDIVLNSNSLSQDGDKNNDGKSSRYLLLKCHATYPIVIGL